MKNKIVKIIGLALGLIIFGSLMACAPKLYVIDRHTIMEQEAAGDWPNFEDAVLKKSKKPGVTFLQKDSSSTKKKRVLNILNGEMKVRE